MKKLVQCVPNFSEGRNVEKIEKIVDSFRGKKDLKLLDYSYDNDHNRCVVTIIGTPESLKESLLVAFGKAKELIDMTSHTGQHPRMGAVDVCPFIPIKNTDVKECDELAKDIAKAIHEEHDMGFFFYEKSASSTLRQNLAKIRKGEYEGMEEKSQNEKWIPDLGEFKKSTGITAIGARMPLVAFNVLLDTNNLDIATKISKAVRHINGGLRFVKGIGIDMPERNITQVSMNLTDYTKTPIYRVFELIKIEAKRYGVNVIGSELIGLAPMDAFIQTTEYYFGIENLDYNQVLEKHLME
ncbi:glutamate formimidoyltransferase [Mycoplasmatota bacterium]|nr:glutamate formimidoyltransferase [Mycoplasmatota bacterium]